MIASLDKENCCGCQACANVCPNQCISFMTDDEGFLYPIVNKVLCSDCNLCEKVCPAIQEGKQADFLKSYAFINKNDETRFKSSSGGVFGEIAKYVLARGGYVFGAAIDINNLVEHICIDKVSELTKIQKSKYLQSDIKASYKHAKTLLEAGELVLFSGTPCQIKALKSFLRKEYDNLISIDVACHGVPSLKVWNTYLDHIGINKKNPYSFDFRDKTKPWHNYSLTIKQEDRIIISESCDKNPFLLSFIYKLCNRPSCHHCPAKSFTSGSDIMLADYWGIEKFYPEMDDNKGTSLVISKTELGNKILTEISCQFIIHETDFKTVECRTEPFYRSSNPHYLRKKFIKNIDKNNFSTLVFNYLKHSYPLHIRIQRALFRILTLERK